MKWNNVIVKINDSVGDNIDFVVLNKPALLCKSNLNSRNVLRKARKATR
jgi:hypothetical protein